jgi:hypothetical protein
VATADSDQAIDPALLLSAAARALYRAKRSGRNRVVHHGSGEAGHRDIECPSTEVGEPSVSVCS